MNIMGLVTFIVGMAMLAAPVRWSFTVMILCTVFGAAAAFSVPGLGGASVLVPSLFLLFFGMRLFLAYGEGPLFAALAPPRPGFCLSGADRLRPDDGGLFPASVSGHDRDDDRRAVSGRT